MPPRPSIRTIRNSSMSAMAVPWWIPGGCTPPGYTAAASRDTRATRIASHSCTSILIGIEEGCECVVRGNTNIAIVRTGDGSSAQLCVHECEHIGPLGDLLLHYVGTRVTR